MVHGQGFTLHKCERRVSENGVLSMGGFSAHIVMICSHS